MDTVLTNDPGAANTVSMEDWLRQIRVTRVAFETQQAGVQDEMMQLMWAYYSSATGTTPRDALHTTMRQLYALENSLAPARSEWVQLEHAFRQFKYDLETDHVLDADELRQDRGMSAHEALNLELRGGQGDDPYLAPFTVDTPLSRETRRLIRDLMNRLGRHRGR